MPANGLMIAALRDPLARSAPRARRSRRRLCVTLLPLGARRLDLLAEHAVVALGLVELLRGRGLLLEEAPRALVRAAGDLALHLEHADLSLRFGDPRPDRRALRAELRALERESRRVDDAERRPAATCSPSTGVNHSSEPPVSAETTDSRSPRSCRRRRARRRPRSPRGRAPCTRRGGCARMRLREWATSAHLQAEGGEIGGARLLQLHAVESAVDARCQQLRLAVDVFRGGDRALAEPRRRLANDLLA